MGKVGYGLCGLIVLSVALLVGSVGRWSMAKQEERWPRDVGEVFTDREPKNFMNLPFLRVVFSPEPCGELNNGVRAGECLAKGKCGIVGGTSGGTCSYGLGECCSITTNCTADRTRVEINEYVTTLKNPPTDATKVPCTFRIKKQKEVCQVRLDFTSAMLANANENGDCEDDRLMIGGSVTVDNGFTVCGTLTGQHMVLTYGTSDSIDITPVISSPSSQYTIVATQIPCNSKRLAPKHCLQYFNTTTGVVKSFGYPMQQQNNQKYTICVEDTETSQRITWKGCTAADSALPSNGRPFDIDTVISQTDLENCIKYDYLQVNGENKICGDNFPDTITTWKPYNLNVRFDQSEVDKVNLPVVSPRVNSESECQAFGQNSGGLFQCFYQALICTCTVLFPSTAFGPPDLNNTGFCLKYNL